MNYEHNRLLWKKNFVGKKETKKLHNSPWNKRHACTFVCQKLKIARACKVEDGFVDCARFVLIEFNGTYETFGGLVMLTWDYLY